MKVKQITITSCASCPFHGHYGICVYPGVEDGDVLRAGRDNIVPKSCPLRKGALFILDEKS